MFWGFVSSRKVGEQPWECACWLFISPLLVRLACLRVSGVDSFSTNLRRVDDSQGCIDPSLPGFAVEKPAMVVVRSPPVAETLGFYPPATKPCTGRGSSSS